ncbi:MAG TPA: CvpA family protein [Anaerolineales bacterium]|nr:CvpA family protein [Anaerolineales bacterium]
MMSLSSVFWLLLIITGIIGGSRGWAREILVLFSLILAMCITSLLQQFLPEVDALLRGTDPRFQFYARATLFMLMAFFGYESPAISSALAGKGKREKLQDILLGFFIGVLNGYLLVGSLWHYMSEVGYPIPGIIPPTDPSVLNYLNVMPQDIVGVPVIYFVTVASFVFVLVVFL